jgi:mannose-6-phosphate isomerase-like protein (cupin superfamily)
VIECESFVVADWTDQGTHPGRPIAGPHLHRSDDEAWIVLSGRLGFRVGNEEREVPAGESLLVPRGTPHSYWGERNDRAQIFEEYDSELLE